jgi:nickel/cobalt transporter (NicO) family protein
MEVFLCYARRMSLLAASVLGLGLGIKHAFEPDHVAAVCTFVARGGSVGRAALSGALWGLGHGAVIVLGGGALIATGASVPPSIAALLEGAVAVMLVGLGIAALLAWRRQRGAPPAPPPAPGKRPLVVGLLHGAAGTAAITIFVASTIPSRQAALAFVGVFGLASVLAMAVVAALLAWPLRSATQRSPSLAPRAQAVAGIASIAAGLVLASQILGGAPPS